MAAGLRRREHEGAGLDGAGAQQHLPVRPAGRHGEGGGHGQDLGAGLGEVAVEVREAQVVADGEAEHDLARLGQHRLLAGPEGGGFAVALAAVERHVEHVDLVVAGADRAVGADQERAVGEAAVRRRRS